MLKLTDRLQAIANLITPCDCVADVGCDHGFLSIYLLQNHITGHVIASDIHAGPIARAREHFQAYQLDNCIDTIQCDGLEGFRDYPNAIVIAGMGGLTMYDILAGRPDILEKATQLILQPQSELQQFRRKLCSLGFRIIAEDFVIEDGKYYPMMKAVHGEMTLTEEEAMYGSILLRERNNNLKLYLEEEANIKQKLYEKLLDSDSEKAVKRREELQTELSWNRKAYNRFLSL